MIMPDGCCSDKHSASVRLEAGDCVVAREPETIGQGTVRNNALGRMDSECVDARNRAKDWAFGPTDLLSVELRQCGACSFGRPKAPKP
jgi:hypothetical protein